MMAKYDWLKRFQSPEEIARSPRRVKGGWAWTFPPPCPMSTHEQSIQNIALALASMIGGVPMGMGAMTSFGGGFMPPPPFSGASSSVPNYSSISLDAAGEYMAMIFQPRKAGDIQGIEFRCHNSTGACTVDLRLETVDATTGFPTGTLFAANTQVTGVTATSAAWIGAASNFTANATVALTDRLAAKILYNSGTLIQVAQWTFTSLVFPYSVENTGTPTKSTSGLGMALRYSDGSYDYIPGLVPWNTFPPTNLTSGTNPNHRGNVFVPPAPLGVVGAWAWIENAAGGTGLLDFILATDDWDGTADNDGTSNWVVTLDNNIATNRGLVYIQFSTRALLSKNATYRLLLKSETGSDINMYQGDVNTSALLNAADRWGTSMYLTTANNPTGAGSWTNTNTSRVFMGLWVDQIDDGVGGGGSSVIVVG